MKPFPEQFELISFFESEPVLCDTHVGWFYNQLKFVTVRDRDRIECEIEPANLILKVRWYKNESQLLDLTLEGVTGLEIQTSGGKEFMRAKLSETSGMGSLIVQLKPTIQIFMEVKMM
jgi:hypothetical protein